MKRFGFGLLFTAMVTTSSQAATTAEPGLIRQFFYSGAVCQPLDGSANANYSQFGVHNVGATPLTVVCPLPISVTRLPPGPPGTLLTENVYTVQVDAYDRDPGPNLANAVTCTLRNLGGDGNPIYSSTPQSTGFSGPSMMALTFTPPTGTTFNLMWDVVCTIPAAIGTSYSHVTNIQVGVKQP
jgi:hypothetical protein